MSRTHAESLKEQLIAAMAGRLGRPVAESVFQHDLWPVLDAAMTAGELLVARNTVPQKPVHEAITLWLHRFLYETDASMANMATVSRRDLLDVIANARASCQIALKDAAMVAEPILPKSAPPSR